MKKLSLPNVNAIAKHGGFSNTFVGGKWVSYTESPTILAAGHNSVLTGAWANKHNVWDNSITAPNYAHPVIFRLLKEIAPQKRLLFFVLAYEPNEIGGRRQARNRRLLSQLPHGQP